MFTYTTTICFTSQFRVFGALSPNFEVALRYCGVSLLIAVIFGGYLIPLDQLISDVPWVGWLAVSLITRAGSLLEFFLTLDLVYHADNVHL